MRSATMKMLMMKFFKITTYISIWLKRTITFPMNCFHLISITGIQVVVPSVVIFCLIHVKRKKKQCFLTHYKQLGGSLTLLANILRRGNLLTIDSINYSIHENSYDFYNAEETMKKFISTIKKTLCLMVR